MQTVTYSAAEVRKLVEADLRKKGLKPRRVLLTATVKYGGTAYDPDITGEATGATATLQS